MKYYKIAGLNLAVEGADYELVDQRMQNYKVDEFSDSDITVKFEFNNSINDKMPVPFVTRNGRSYYETDNEIGFYDYIKEVERYVSFMSTNKKLQTLLITSTFPSEGKSWVASNLAVTFAQAGNKVILIDADMRKGRLHKMFKLSNTKGYSDLLIDNIENFGEYIKKTNIPGVSVITRGTIPPNPSELLNSTKNKELIKELKRHYDKIIFDGVPCSGLPDSIIMSSLVDKVIIVSSNGYTPKNEFMSTINTLEKAKAPIAGFIVNKIDSTQGTYGKYYYYYGDKK